MNTIAIIILSMLGGFLLLLILIGFGYLGYQQYQLRKLLRETGELLPTLLAEYRATLTDEIGTLNAKIAQIDGEKLLQASLSVIQAAKRIETAAVAFGELARYFLSNEGAEEISKVRATGLPPEEYATAAPGETFLSTGRTAALDSDNLVGSGEQD